MSKDQDDWYTRIAAQWGAALQRVARSCEADPDRRRDVLQEMHVALWKSHRLFDGRCSERTWIYRIANNVAANHVNRERRRNAPLVSLDLVDDIPGEDSSHAFERDIALQKLFAIIERLGNPDRSVITLYLEGLDANTIGEITGMSPGAIDTLSPFTPGGPITDNPAVIGPAGRVHATAADILAYLEAHARKSAFLSPDNWKRLHTPPFGGTYALGWERRKDTVWHNGSNTLWYAEIQADLARGTIAMAAVNDGRLGYSTPAVGTALKEALLAVS